MSSGVAGRTDYREWDKKVSDLVEESEKKEVQDKEEAAKALGLDGKYAFSHAEAMERQKAEDVAQAKRVLDGYRKRESDTVQTFAGLLDSDDESKRDAGCTVRITRERMGAGKRVVTICDTEGSSSTKDLIVLTQDLSHLESKMSVPSVQPKSYPDDAENGVKEEQRTQERTIYGLIKVNLSNLRNCTVSIKCKVISGTVEMSHCSNVVLRIEREATVATLQCDLSQHIVVEFRDAPSGKNTNLPGQRRLHWGDDADDRIFHAGVSDMMVSIVRDGFVETSTKADYLKDGAETVGNAAPEEFQFVTSVVDGELLTEKVIRHGGTTGKNARAMTQRELDKEKQLREEAAKMAIEKAESMIKITNKDGKELPVVKKNVEPVAETVEEVYTSMEKQDIDSIIAECEQNKSRGNEAFGSGEYAQAVLLYSLALDKAAELPDKGTTGDKQLFPRHIVLSNRSAAFLKLGDHANALKDGTKAQELDPTYVKGIFRRGVALHAMGKFSEALQVLAAAQKIEPKNKQIKQALQFAEVRMTQEMRKRMEQ